MTEFAWGVLAGLTLFAGVLAGGYLGMRLASRSSDSPAAPAVASVEAVVTMTMSAPVSMFPADIVGFGGQCQWQAIGAGDMGDDDPDDEPTPDGLDPSIWGGMDGNDD